MRVNGREIAAIAKFVPVIKLTMNGEEWEDIRFVHLFHSNGLRNSEETFEFISSFGCVGQMLCKLVNISH